jgi:hypothetical protein
MAGRFEGLSDLEWKLVVNQANGQVICTAFGKGQMHDFHLFKRC